MIRSGTLFQHLNIRKLTWTPPNWRDLNQIDHLLVNTMWCCSLLDIGVKEGADANSITKMSTILKKKTLNPEWKQLRNQQACQEKDPN